jgi:hypothetical protein
MASQSEDKLNCSDAEFLDVERHDLIDRLNQALVPGESNANLSHAMWATLWLSSIGRLRVLVEHIELSDAIYLGYLYSDVVEELILKPCIMLTPVVSFLSMI